MWSDDDENLRLAAVGINGKPSASGAAAKRALARNNTNSDESSQEEGVLLEILPPAAYGTQSLDDSRKKSGPRLSITGERPTDAIELLADDDTDDNNNYSTKNPLDDDDDSSLESSFNVPLAQRLRRDNLSSDQNNVKSEPTSTSSSAMTSSTANTGDKKNKCFQLGDDDDDDDLLLPAASSAADSENKLNTTTNLKRPRTRPPTKHQQLDLNSDDDSNEGSEDSMDIINRQLNALRGSKNRNQKNINNIGSSSTFSTSNKIRSKTSDTDASPAPPQRPSTNAIKRKHQQKRQPNASHAAVDKEAREAERKRVKMAKAAEKEQAKQERAKARQDAKAAKEATAAQLKVDKQRQKVALDQVRGKYAHLEVACLIDSKWLEEGSGGNAVATVVRHDMAESGGYIWHPFTHLLNCVAVQWIRQNFVKGGAAHARAQLLAGEHAGYEHIPLLVIVVDGQSFLNLLERDYKDQDDDYPELEYWLRGIEESYKIAWKAKTNKAPRIILLLDRVKEQLDKTWKKYTKAKKKDPNLLQPPTENELHDAITWILIEFQVEVIFCSTLKEIVHHLSKITRMLGEKPYQKQVTELECSRKLKSQIDADSTELERAQDTWFRQIQQIPRVSQTMARCFTQYYPTATSLWEAYQDPSLSELDRQMLVANCFSSNSTQGKLSVWMYEIMTSDDPSELLR